MDVVMEKGSADFAFFGQKRSNFHDGNVYKDGRKVEQVRWREREETTLWRSNVGD